MTTTNHHRDSRARFAIPLLLLITFAQAGFSQRSPLALGELGVEIKNSSDLPIAANASGSVGGSRNDWYSTTHDYDSRSATTITWWLQHLDRVDPPGTDSGYFAYGAYTITIQNHSVIMDYRDADYEDGEGDFGFGTGYNTADLKIYYNAANGVFYKDAALTQAINDYIAIWHGGRKDSSISVKVPATVKNSFGGGHINVGGTSMESPYKGKWAVNSSCTLSVVTPQTYNCLNYGFTEWDDEISSQTRVISVSLSQFGTTYTANFSVVSPERVTNFSAGGSIGDNPHLTWDVHVNADVNYYVYRKVRHNGVTGSESLIATLNHGTSTYDDQDYVIAGSSSDQLFYDVRAHHTPSNTFAGSWFLSAGFGETQVNTPPEEALLAGPMDARGLTTYAVSAHPNPFNPSTLIRCQLPRAADVQLAVYDILGREVAVLMDGWINAGVYDVRFDAAGLSSGIYFYRLQAGRSVHTRSLHLVR